MSLLKGTAFITGAASGIGKATALAFARHGINNLALADLSIESLQPLTTELAASHPHISLLPLAMNVRSTPDIKTGIAELVSRFGRLDIAVNNAGIGGSGNQTHEIEEEEWARVLDVDLHGVWRCQKEELAVMVKQEDKGWREGRGCIVNTASMYGLLAPAGGMHHTAYAAAKHGVMGLTKGDANSYGPVGIRINAICPGYVETPLIKRAIEVSEALRKDVDRSPKERMAHVDEIGDGITFLASPMASFMQGAGLVVDGGFTTQ